MTLLASGGCSPKGDGPSDGGARNARRQDSGRRRDYLPVDEESGARRGAERMMRLAGWLHADLNDARRTSLVVADVETGNLILVLGLRAK